MGNLTGGRPLSPDAAAYAAYVILGLGLVGMRDDRRADLIALLDALLLGGAALALFWRFLVQPAIALAHAPVHVRVILAGYPAASVVMIVLAARLAFEHGWTWHPHQLALFISIVLLCMGDVLSELADAHIANVSSLWIYGIYGGAYISATIAMLHPSLSGSNRPISVRRKALGTARLGLIGLSFAGPAVLAIFPRTDHADPTLAVIVLGLTAIAIARLTMLLRSQDNLILRATTDGLTGLANRAAFDESLPAMLQAARKANQPIAVAFIDLDNFKQINDTYGHPTGDDVLRNTARRIVSATRGTDLVARNGGDEFVMVLNHPVSPASASQILERLRADLSRPLGPPHPRIATTASIGLAYFPPQELPANASLLLTTADARMYESKSAGRNRVTTNRTPSQLATTTSGLPNPGSITQPARL